MWWKFVGLRIMEGERGDEMDEEKRSLVMDRVTKVCICKAIPRSKVKEGIRRGADTVQKVHAAVGTGSGACGGRRCAPKIAVLLEEYKDGGWV